LRIIISSFFSILIIVTTQYFSLGRRFNGWYFWGWEIWRMNEFPL
jgi:hypothetical protein